MAVCRRSKPCGRGLSLQPIGCTTALSVTQNRRCSCDMRLVGYVYKCYMPLPLLGFVHIGGYEQLYHRYMVAIPNTTFGSNSTCGLPRDDAWIMLRNAFTSDMPWPAFLLGQTPASIWYWCTDQVRSGHPLHLSVYLYGVLFSTYNAEMPPPL